MPLLSGVTLDQQWQIGNGFAVQAPASRLATAEFAGRGLYQPYDQRDFYWVYIEKAQVEGESVRLTWLDKEEGKPRTIEGVGVTTVIKETVVVRRSVCVPATQSVVVSAKPVGKPTGFRTTNVTTREALGDDDIVDAVQ